MTPRAEPDRDKRARILDAALQASERRGVDGVRMEEVAALARVSKGTLYRFFASKEELLLAAMLESYRQYVPWELEAGGGGDARSRLAHLLDALVKVLETIAPRMSVHYQAWGVVAGDPALQRQLYAFLRDFHAARDEALAAVVRDGQRRGEFRADADPLAFAEAAQALLSGFLYRATFDPARAAPDRLRQAFRLLVLDSLELDGAPAGGDEDV